VRTNGSPQTFENFQGAIDEVELFDRALSAVEVHALFAARRSGKCKIPLPSRTPSPTATATPCLGELCLTKFNDVNGNGVQDAGEPGLAGWNIEITDPIGSVVAFVATGAAGTVCTGVPGAAPYTVFELPQAGWTQTFPPAPGLHSVFVECGQLLNLGFGNFRSPSATSTPTRTPTNTPKVPPVD